ncbi:hypothetical protein P5V15_010734 [Pogonomyrmex californicus]
MLKIVGASWLQTRISTYILIAVGLLGIGAIILGEYGHVEKDEIYSATVSWNHKGGYHIDFWGQGNDLNDIPLNAARAYYKNSILESGWSIIEIETSSKYPDTVQAYAAGMLEGSLTWQMIHHHWQNTVNVICKKRPGISRIWKLFLRTNSDIVRKEAESYAATDPFWHMVRLFYLQLDGLEAGWKFAVRRSRQTVEMSHEDFLWLAMATDLRNFEKLYNYESYRGYIESMISLKKLPREGLDPIIAIGHTTAAPYANMLRLLKKYTFNYHVLPMSKTSALVPSRSVIMSSYPGALSSQDEFYLIQRENRELIVAGTQALTGDNRSGHEYWITKFNVMPSAKTMVANRLATDGYSWFRIRYGPYSRMPTDVHVSRQWVILEPHDAVVWHVEQTSKFIRIANVSEEFANTGVFCVIAKNHFRESSVIINGSKKENGDDVTENKLVARLQSNITTMEHFRRLMRGYSHEESTTKNENQIQSLINEEDLEKIELPFGIIDTKIIVADTNGVESFEAISGPITVNSTQSFQWSTTYPNVSHVGQPDIFNFDSVTPLWVWL